jgi:hypothetical protein
LLKDVTSMSFFFSYRVGLSLKYWRRLMIASNLSYLSS